MKMQRIVVGLDGSPESTVALEWAADLALLTGAEITAVTVFDTGPYMSWGVAPAYVPDLGEIKAGITKELESWCEPLRRRETPHRVVVREGSAAAELLNEAAALHADLLVVGSRGRGGFRELILGSVAHTVTQHSRHPVVVVPRGCLVADAETEPPSAGAVGFPPGAVLPITP